MMESIRRLREMTGAGMMDVKNALTEANGDEDRAVALLRERGIVKAAKKADREATDGLVRAFVSPDGRAGALVEVNSETDFVARNSDFQALVADLARNVAESGEVNGTVAGSELSGQRFLGSEETVGDRLAAAIAKIGENLVIRRAARFETADGLVASYIHANDRLGVLLELAGPREAAEAIAKDLTLHIAAQGPRYLSREEVDAADLERERDILTNKALNEGKPQNIVEKIVSGQLAKFYEENVLLEQRFVRDDSVTVKSLLGDGVSVRRFARFQIGA